MVSQATARSRGVREVYGTVGRSWQESLESISGQLPGNLCHP